ncbi:ShlB/FhaC/HecB family hemolysin secretion/activation protein [Pannus brasiliensis CCIBt3594]|uniref:ShlB/FhaC/HecB family hemolysin secretion/activation protein n=1 Tax=Pannus brasiliensis CCIBt3594 TaxID=1427578 RepID=A0AAW9QY17_9CHRO
MIYGQANPVFARASGYLERFSDRSGVSVPTAPVEASPVSPSPVLKKVEVLGSTLLSEDDIARIISPYVGKEISSDTIEEITRAIASFYHERGYRTSDAYPPPQDLSGGTLKIQVIEGKLEAINIEGLTHLREGYVRDRLMAGGNFPLNIERLEEKLQLLRSDPLFARVNAELSRGTSPDSSVLNVQIEEAPHFSAGLQVDNYEYPSVGEYRGTLEIAHGNLLGFGDRLAADYGLAEGLDRFDIAYTLPIDARDGKLSVAYQNGESQVIEDFLRDVGIRSRANTLSFGFRQPLIQRPTEELALSLSLDLRESRTFLLDKIPFSFTPGPDNGRSRVTALRLTGEWIERSSRRVVLANSQFSVGLPLFDATTNDIGIDGTFFSWLGQFQWWEKLDDRVMVIGRLATQLTPDALLPIEQFDIGGIDTVRGYPKGFRVGDSGLVASVETRFTLLDDAGWGSVALSPFVDLGTVWNNRLPIASPNTLASTGLELRWEIENLAVRLDYGIPLIRDGSSDHSLQGEGFSFSVRWERKI